MNYRGKGQGSRINRVTENCHCEERSDEAILFLRLLRFARNDKERILGQTIKVKLIPLIPWHLTLGTFVWVMFIFLGCQSLQAKRQGDPNVTTAGWPSDQEQPRYGNQPDYEAGELIVQLKSDILQFPAETTGEVSIEMVTFQDESFRSLCERAQVVSIQYVYTGKRESLPENMRRTYLFRFQQGVEVKEWLRHFEQNPQVVYAEPNYRAYIQEK